MNRLLLLVALCLGLCSVDAGIARFQTVAKTISRASLYADFDCTIVIVDCEENKTTLHCKNDAASKVDAPESCWSPNQVKDKNGVAWNIQECSHKKIALQGNGIPWPLSPDFKPSYVSNSCDNPTNNKPVLTCTRHAEYDFSKSFCT